MEKFALQVEPQLIPDGELVTVPLPDFDTARVLARRFSANTTPPPLVVPE